MGEHFRSANHECSSAHSGWLALDDPPTARFLNLKDLAGFHYRKELTCPRKKANWCA